MCSNICLLGRARTAGLEEENPQNIIYFDGPLSQMETEKTCTFREVKLLIYILMAPPSGGLLREKNVSPSQVGAKLLIIPSVMDGV